MSLSAYPEYKESGVEWLGQVPSHWEIKRLRFAVQINPSKSEVAHLDPDLEVSFLPMEAIGEDGLLDLERSRRLEEVGTGYTYFREGDVAVAKITPCFENGKGAVMKDLKHGVGFGTTELIVTRPRPDQVTPRYLHWLYSSRPFRCLGEAAMYGAGGQKRVPDDFVRDFSTGLPGTREQAVIVTFLDRETGKIDALVAEQEKLIELLREKRQAVISHAVTKGLDPDVPIKDSGIEWLGDVPAHWGIRKLSTTISKITNGYVGPTRDVLVEEGVRYLQSLHIKNNEIHFNIPYFVSKEWSAVHEKSILKVGDVLVVQTGDIGQVAVVPEEYAGSNCHALIVITPISKFLRGDWLSWVLNSPYGLHTLRSIQTGALHPHLNCGNVKDVFIPLPKLDEQRSIVAHLTKTLSEYHQLVDEAQQAVGLLMERRAALISAAVTGKIDVRGLIAVETTEAA